MLDGTLDAATYRAKAAEIDADMGAERLALDRAGTADPTSEAVLDRVLATIENAGSAANLATQKRRVQQLVIPKGIAWTRV